jgi:hypothetical protein
MSPDSSATGVRVGGRRKHHHPQAGRRGTQRLIFPILVNGPFLKVMLQEIAYEKTNIIYADSNCR